MLIGVYLNKLKIKRKKPLWLSQRTITHLKSCSSLRLCVMGPEAVTQWGLQDPTHLPSGAWESNYSALQQNLEESVVAIKLQPEHGQSHSYPWRMLSQHRWSPTFSLLSSPSVSHRHGAGTWAPPSHADALCCCLCPGPDDLSHGWPQIGSLHPPLAVQRQEAFPWLPLSPIQPVLCCGGQ